MAKPKFNRKLVAIILIIVIAIAIVVSWQIYLQSSATKPSTLPQLNLTLIGANGQQKNLTSSEMASLKSYTSSGGYIPESGKPNFGNYTGVPILTLLNLVGGISSGQNVTVTGSDGYHITFTYQQVQGEDLNTYNSTSRALVLPTEPLTMIVAYYCNGTALPSGQGPLTIAIVGPQGLGTPGAYWVYLLVKIQVIAG